MRIRIVLWLALLSMGAAGACAAGGSGDDGDVGLPPRIDGASDGSLPEQDGDSTAPDSSDDAAGDAAPAICGTMNGLDIICMRPKDSFVAAASVSYGPGFSAGLPAMGLGKPLLGYLPSNYPFTCLAKAGANAISANNPDGGKICEVVFDNQVTKTTIGTGTYTVRIDPGAAAGIFEVGYLANTGATPQAPGFFVKVVP